MAKRIDVKDLNLFYGKFHAVEGVSMTIPARSVTALIGPSGCGKSTFLRSLNRMHEVIPGARVEGKVVVDGQSLYDAAVDHDLALDAGTRDHLVHPVQRPEEGRLAAAGRADERGHRPRLDGHVDALDGLEVAVVDVEVGDVDALGHGSALLDCEDSADRAVG